ncbi:hypothetical protein FRC11_004203 [Ceratobasidium sp. 423]|nr:hypothetical protein FRC11_004203 [Ceratobasidium sp. 423]
MRKLTDPQPTYTVPSNIPDTNEDQPVGQTVIVLGAILRALAGEFPRESYKIATKCGRYGEPPEDFDYSRDTIRKSIRRSLDRLGTNYLDVVFLHDTEFVCSPVWPSDPTGDPTRIFEDQALAAAWGISDGDEGRVHGAGDQKIIDAFDELGKMKDEGVIREIGLTGKLNYPANRYLSGYPLPVLLRLGRLVAAKGNPADVIMSYSHSNLQNHAFEVFAPLLLQTGVKQLLTASPFNMGYLTNRTPGWHPAPPEMVSLKDNQIMKLTEKWPGGLPNLAMGYALRRNSGVMADIPTVAGFSRTSEVHEAMTVWREVMGGVSSTRHDLEVAVIQAVKDAGWENYSWKRPHAIVMSRSHSVERGGKPLPPVPQADTEPPPTSSSLTDHLASTLKKMSENLPTTEYRSPLNISGRVHQGISDLTKDVVVPHGGRPTHHHDRHGNHHREREDSYPAETIRPAHREIEEESPTGDSITSAERIRRGWQQRQDSSHHRSRSGEQSKHTTSPPPPTAYRTGEGFPWFAGGPAQPGRQGSLRGHHRERSDGTPPQGSEFYEHSDESGQSSLRLEIHNATPLHHTDSMKSRGRPSLGTRLRSSFQKARVGAARPAKERTDLSRSPSPDSRRRSPSPRAWRKPSPHSSIRATDTYSTPRTGGGLPDSLPRIESQRMDLGWEGPADSGTQSPPRPPIEAIPTIPDLHTPGRHPENEPRTVPIIEPDKPRMVEIHEQPPSYRVESSQSTSALVNPPTQREPRRHRGDSDEHLVLRNFDGPFFPHGGHNEGPGKLKRLLSLSNKPVPIEGDNGPSSPTSSSPTRSKLVSTPAALIRSTSLIRTRNRRKESSKHRERVEPDTHVGYESDPWGEGQEVHRDAQGNRIYPQEPKRKTSQKKKSQAHTGPTKIALPMGQVEEFHSVHSNSPTEPQYLDPVSSDPKSRGEHKRTISTTTFHTAQSGNTRPGSPTRKMSSQSTLQVKPSAPDTKYDGWRRSRSGAPRRPSETLLASPPSNGNQYADEAPILHDQPLFTDPQEYDQEAPGHVHGPRMPSPVPPRVAASSTPDSPSPVVSASPALAGGPPPLIRTSPPRRNTPPPLISTPPPRIVTPPPAMSMPVPMPAPAPVAPLRVIPPRSERPLPPEPIQEPRSTTPPVPVRTPSPHGLPAHASPDQSPPIQTPRAHTPDLEDHIQINPADTLPGESHGYEDLRYRPPLDPHSYGGPEVRSPVPDTPSYVLPRQPTPTLTTPGVMLNPPSGATSPTIDRDLSPRPDSPLRSVRIEYQERPPTGSILSNRPMPRHLAGLSESEQQMRQQNRQTGSEMSFVTVEPLTKREKLAASVLSISSMPWRNRVSSRSHHPDSSYHSTHDGDSRYYYDRHRHPMDYPTSETPPQLPPVDTGSAHTAPLRSDASKELPMWYPREQTARNPVRQPSPQRESRGPRVNQEAWGWRSSPHGIPEETEDNSSIIKPSWQHGPGAVTPSPDTPKGDGMLAPPAFPPRPVVSRTPDSEMRPSGEKKRVPKYRIEQDDRGHPVLVPEPGFDDSRWTVFEIGGVEFKRAQGDPNRGTQWFPKRLSGMRRSDARPHDYQYSGSPAATPAPLEGRQYNA